MKKPVLFLIFNRPDTTQKVFEAIRSAKPPRLYVASDGARFSKEGEKDIVEKTRKLVLNNIDWDCEVKTLLREENAGCRKAVSEAITWFFENEEDGIILEDDCSPDQSFFKFCEDLLGYYKDNKKIKHISGDQFIPGFDNGSSYYFAKIMHCWGWASWADRWKLYGINLEDYSEKNIEKFSDDENVQKYWLNILRTMKKNSVDSWAYQWAFRIVEHDGLCINPSVNLISNIGFDISGTHTVDAMNPFANMKTYEMENIIHPKSLDVDVVAVDYIYQNHFGINLSIDNK